MPLGASFSRVTKWQNSASSISTCAGIGAGLVQLLHQRQRGGEIALHREFEQVDDMAA